MTADRDRHIDLEPLISAEPTAAATATPLSVLRDVFGYEDFRPGQLKVIEAVMAGRDCIALMPPEPESP